MAKGGSGKGLLFVKMSRLARGNAMKGKGDLEPTAEERLQEAFIETDEMGEFLDAQDKARAAAERGDEEVSLPSALISRIFAAVQPLDLAHLRAVWNRVCDEMGMPEQKQAMPDFSATDMTTGKKISVRKEPIYYRKDKEE